MSYEDVKCKACGRIGQNVIEEGCPCAGHPNVEEKWLVCKCGEAIQEITE